MKLIDIIDILEKKNSGSIIDFVINYDFNDNYDKYYLNYILKYNFDNKNVLLSAYIVELAFYKKLKQKEIKELFKKIINSKYNYFLKVSILDYFIDLNINLKKSEIIDMQKKCQRAHLMLKVQILILNIYYKYEINWSFNNLIILLKKRNLTHIEIIRILDLFINHQLKINQIFDNTQINELNDSIQYYKYNSIKLRYDKFKVMYQIR